MAVAIKAINAKIRSNKVLDYFCSTRKSSSLRRPSDRSLFPFLRPQRFHGHGVHAEQSRKKKKKYKVKLTFGRRFLGPSVEFRNPDCRGDGYPEGCRNVRCCMDLGSCLAGSHRLVREELVSAGRGSADNNHGLNLTPSPPTLLSTRAASATSALCREACDASPAVLLATQCQMLRLLKVSSACLLSSPFTASLKALS